MQNKILQQHGLVVTTLKKSLPHNVTFMSLYRSVKNGYCLRAVINKEDYYFTMDEHSPLTNGDIQRLKNLVLSKAIKND